MVLRASDLLRCSCFPASQRYRTVLVPYSNRLCGSCFLIQYEYCNRLCGYYKPGGNTRCGPPYNHWSVGLGLQEVLLPPPLSRPEYVLVRHVLANPPSSFPMTLFG